LVNANIGWLSLLEWWLIRGTIKEWIYGFSKFIGVCRAYMTKLWGILEGLNLAKLCGFKYIELHVDPMGPYTVYSLSNSMIESVGG